MSHSKFRIGVAIVIILSIGVILGFAISYCGVHHTARAKANILDSLTEEADEKWSSYILDSMRADNIRTYLR